MSTRQDKAQAVVQEARTWLRTPFADCQAAKGFGVDCANFAAQVYRACGLLPEGFKVPSYSPDWMLHRNEEIFLAELCKLGHEVCEPRTGDLLIWGIGRTFSHVAIAISNWVGGECEIIHAYKPAGMVTLGRTSETRLADRPVKFFRVEALS